MVHAYAGSRAGLKSIISICELNTDATKAITQSRIVFDGHEAHQTCEGPKLSTKEETITIYSILQAACLPGGRLCSVPKNIWPLRMEESIGTRQQPVNGPHQGAWVDTPTGEDWFLHFQDVGAYGRWYICNL